MEYTDITIGNLPVKSITLGNLPVWDDSGIEITISPTSVSISSAYTAFTVTVDSSDDTWDVYSPLSWIGCSKQSNTSARVTVYTNQYATGRTGYVYFQVDDHTYATLTINQAPAPYDPFPSGWDIIEEDGDWALAVRQQTNYYTFAIIYRYENTAPPSDYYANWDFDFEWDDEGDTQYDNLNGSQQIDANDTFDYTSHTYYGIELGEVPNLDDSTISVNNFEVYAT